MRLIDKDALMKDLEKWLKQVDPTHPQEDNAIPPMENIIVSTLMTIEEQPTIEPEQQWIDAIREVIKCSGSDGFIIVPKDGIEGWDENGVHYMMQPERKKGKWIQDPKSKRYRCDQCLSFALKTDDGQENLSDFCPVCGSAMEGEQNVCNQK